MNTSLKYVEDFLLINVYLTRDFCLTGYELLSKKRLESKERIQDVDQCLFFLSIFDALRHCSYS